MKITPVSHNTIRVELENSDLILTIRDSSLGYLDITEGVLDGHHKDMDIDLILKGDSLWTFPSTSSVRISKCKEQ
jgi:hypothetical protein